MLQLTAIEQRKYDHALHYPGVDVGDFDFAKGSYVLSKNSDGEWNKSGLSLDGVKIVRNGGGVSLNDASQKTPLENLILKNSDGQEFDLQQRVPILGIGSNSSSDVLSKKFADASGQQDIAVFQVKVQNHVVAHSAFLTEEGGVAVSVFPHEGGYTHATLGFYTEELANRLTGTEFNYDGVALDAPIEFPVDGIAIRNPLAYVSAWGVITKDGQTPLGTTHIPGSLTDSISTAEAIEFCRSVTDLEKDTRTFMIDNIRDDPERLRRTNILKDKFAFPAQIRGQQIFPAIKSGQEGFPAIQYN